MMVQRLFKRNKVSLVKNTEEDFGEGSNKGNKVRLFIGGNKYEILSIDKKSYIAPNFDKEILETNEIGVSSASGDSSNNGYHTKDIGAKKENVMHTTHMKANNKSMANNKLVPYKKICGTFSKPFRVDEGKFAIDVAGEGSKFVEGRTHRV